MAEQGPLSGHIVGEKYLLAELLGEGGFGAVYKAQHLQIQRQQAIKILLERHFRKSDFRERFVREAQTVATLDHPCIIHLDDFWLESSQAYLVMPFISGGTLQDILRKQQGFLELEQVTAYLESICAALDYAHEREVVHLDLKPLNLLVHEDGRLLLSDFGLAHLMKQGMVEGGASLKFGTPHYMAPEHIQGNPERQSDVYALGVMLYQMLTGRRPFEGQGMAVMAKCLTELPPPLHTWRSDVPKALEVVLERALAKEMAQRYQSAGELLVAFKDALAHGHSGPYEAEEKQRGKREEQAHETTGQSIPAPALEHKPDAPKQLQGSVSLSSSTATDDRSYFLRDQLRRSLRRSQFYRHKVICRYLLLGAACVVALMVIGGGFSPGTTLTNPLFWIGEVLYSAGFLVSWLWSLTDAARLRRWGWCGGLLLFHVLALSIYVFAGPNTPPEKKPEKKEVSGSVLK